LLEIGVRRIWHNAAETTNSWTIHRARKLRHRQHRSEASMTAKSKASRKSDAAEPAASAEAERKRNDKALDTALENTFPASDPVSIVQPGGGDE
jgi:hypothetical protein